MENISNNYIEIFKGSEIINSKSQKVIVFDLDETIGCFVDLNILWNKILQKLKIDCNQENFNSILDLYPDFFRTNIFHILKFLHKKKKNGECKKVFLYTNNNCGNDWSSMIVDYIHYKMNIAPELLFDDIVDSCEFDSRRDTHHKTYNDFVNCVMLSKNTTIGFIDNSLHKGMKHEKVYYIKPKSYFHPYSRSEIVAKFTNSKIYKKIFPNSEIENEFLRLIHNYNNIKYYDPPIQEIEIQKNENKIVSKKIMYYLKEFFYVNKFKKTKTQKINLKIGRFTRKKAKPKIQGSDWI